MIHFQLVSLKGMKFDEDVYEVLVPTELGTIGIFQDHMPLVSAAAPGIISVRRKQGDADDSMEHFTVMGGIIEVDGKLVRFLADDVTAPEDVSEAEAEAALARAKELIKNAKDQATIAEAQQLMRRSTILVQASKLKKRRH
jgi:ATP synthase F1 epsilon subunit